MASKRMLYIEVVWTSVEINMPRHLWEGEYKAMNAVMSPAKRVDTLFINAYLWMHNAYLWRQWSVRARACQRNYHYQAIYALKHGRVKFFGLQSNRGFSSVLSISVSRSMNFIMQNYLPWVVAVCHCSLSGLRIEAAGWKACVPFWARLGVVRQGSCLREELLTNDEW